MYQASRAVGCAFLVLVLGLFFMLSSAHSQVRTVESPLHVASPEETQSPVLVDPEWLAERIAQPDTRVLEIGEQELYSAGHIPNALFVDWIQDITDPVMPERYTVLSREQLESLLGRLGINKNTTVVLYDKLQSRIATRMLWTLRYYGHQRIKILDGGATAWSASGRPFSTEEPTVAKSEYHVERVNPGLEASREFIRTRLSGKQCVLIDGRPTAQYTGEQPGKVYHTGQAHARLGHLPQAVNIPWQENLAADGRFKSVNDLRKLYNSHSVNHDATIVTYCNEGLHAAHPWFVLTELLGYDDVRLYDDSLSEWANTPDEPLIVNKVSSQKKP